jgi:hypothetical protein
MGRQPWHRTQAQQNPQQTHQPGSQTQQHTEAWNRSIAQVQQPQPALTAGIIQQVIQDGHRRRANFQAQLLTEREEQNHIWQQSSRDIDGQSDMLERSLINAPQRQQTQQVSHQQLQQPQNQAQQDGHVQVQQGHVNEPGANAMPIPMFKPFFHGLSKDLEAPPLAARDSPSTFEPMFPMFSKSAPNNASHTQSGGLVSILPAEDDVIAANSTRRRKRAAPKEPSEGSPTETNTVLSTGDDPLPFQQHKRRTSERKMSIEAAKRGVNHIDLTGAAPAIPEKPEELNSAGHATSADPAYTAKMDVIRRRAFASEQAVTQEPTAMIEDANSSSAVVPGQVYGLALAFGSASSPAPATMPEMHSDFSILFSSGDRNLGSSPFLDSFDGAGGAPAIADNSGILDPIAFADIFNGAAPETIHHTMLQTVDDAEIEVPDDASPEDAAVGSQGFDSSMTKLSKTVSLKVDKEFLASLEPRSLIVRLRYKLPPIAPQSLRVGFILIPDYQPAGLQFPDFQTSILPNQLLTGNEGVSTFDSDAGHVVGYNAMQDGVHMGDVESPAVRDAMNNFLSNYRQNRWQGLPSMDPGSQTLHRTPYNPVHVESLGLPSSPAHADAMTRVRGPDYDFSFSENDGVDAPLPNEESRRLCETYLDGSLRAPNMPYDEMRANLEFELRQAEATEFGINHNDVVFDAFGSQCLSQELAIFNIDARINTGVNASRLGVNIDGSEDVVLSDWLQDWVLENDNSGDEKVGHEEEQTEERMEGQVGGSMEVMDGEFLEGMDMSFAGLDLDGMDTSGPVEEWFPELFEGLDL